MAIAALTVLPVLSGVAVLNALSGTATQVPARTDAVEIQMSNVNFRVAKGIVLNVDHLRGRLKSTHGALPVTFDDPDSFVVEIDTGQVSINTDSLVALMNSYTLGDSGTSLKDVKIRIKGGKLVIQGTLHKAVPLPFEVEGVVSATNDGNIRVHATRIKAGHLPVKGLLHFFGEDLSMVVKLNNAKGMRLDGDDIILTPSALTPPPHLEGRVTSVSLKGDRLVQSFDSGRHSRALSPPLRSTAYIYHRGGILRFGKLTMSDADLEIVGDRPGPFEFFEREYQKQLIAGYSKTTAANGLVVHMVDYSRFEADPHAQR